MNFNKEVIEESYRHPILVDFWAEWCGPCKFLGPMLEELERQQSDWKLIKVDVDENQELSQQFNINGIPDIKLFKNGEIIGQFTGAKPKHELEKWLAELLPDKRIDQINILVQNAANKEDHSELEKFVLQNPDFKYGFLALGKQIIWGSPEKISNFKLNINPGEEYYDIAFSLEMMSGFLMKKFKSQNPIEELLISVQKYLSSKNFEEAVIKLIDSVIINKNYEDELPRKVTISLFNLLGKDHEVTENYRRKFDMSLY